MKEIKTFPAEKNKFNTMSLQILGRGTCTAHDNIFEKIRRVTLIQHKTIRGRTIYSTTGPPIFQL